MLWVDHCCVWCCWCWYVRMWGDGFWVCGGGCGDDRVEGRVEGLWRRVDGLAHWVRRVG